MLGYELKKLLFKQHGLILAVLFALIEIITLNFLYSKTNFPNMSTKEQYIKYMQIMSGEITEEKKEFILSEHKKILTAQSEFKSLQEKIISGELADDEYLSKYVMLEPELKKTDAFLMAFNRYKYAYGDPNRRYIMEKCGGLCRDYPDIPIILFIVSITSVCFLSEENTRMIVLIRSYANGKKKTFVAKLLALMFTIFTMAFTIAILELIMIYRAIGAEAFMYPIQSIEYFSGCTYNMTIFQVFSAITLLRTIGYLFIIFLTIFLCVIVKKPVPVMTVPLALCLLQQFIFSTADKAYYIPTGFLRASGYFKGDTYNYNTSELVFSVIPTYVLFLMALLIVIIICFVIIIGGKYYNGNNKI